MANILAALMQAAEGGKRRIKNYLAYPVDEAEAMTNRAAENLRAMAIKKGLIPGAAYYNPQYASEGEQQLLDTALGAMTVYHGSPHKFDKFDMSKIGTGEGAQAYGHGLYMAESPGVARSYADELSRNRLTPKGEQMVEQRIAKDARNMERSGWGTFEEAKDYLSNEEWSRYLDETIDQLDAIEKGFAYEPNLYKVDIPDEAVARMLDWDKPLSQQAPEVRAVMDELIKTPPQGIQGVKRLDWISAMIDAAHMRPGVENRVGGQSLYNTIGGFLGQDAATELLKSKGIPGIRYLDQASRGAGTGTSNYVLFDDQLARILERNNVPTGNQPWQPGEYNALARMVR